jgi:hypothetical protein
MKSTRSHLSILQTVMPDTATGALDLQAARAAGWSDADILDAVNHGARMVAGDIVINGFKVECDF